MKTGKTIAILAAVTSAITPTAYAENRVGTAFDIYTACSTKEFDGFCQGFVSGVFSSYTGVLCGLLTKGGLEPGQLKLIFQDWARRHPAKLHGNAGTAVTDSIKEAFPCTETEK